MQCAPTKTQQIQIYLAFFLLFKYCIPFSTNNIINDIPRSVTAIAAASPYLNWSSFAIIKRGVISVLYGKFPEINIKIGSEEGIYYFGYVILKYDKNNIIDIKIENNLKEDLSDAKKYISGYKKLKIFDLTDKVKDQVESKNLK